MSRTGRSLLAGLIFAALLMLPATALAKTVTLGDANDGTYSNDGFGDPVTLVNTVLPGVPSAASPVSGTVISWRVNSPNGKFALQVLKAKENGDYTDLHSSSTKELRAIGAVSRAQRTHLAIRKGQYIAISLLSENAHIGLGDGGTDTSFYPPLKPGKTQTPFPYNPFHAGYSAVVRYCEAPNVEGLTLKVAKKRLHRADCTVGKVDKPRRAKPSDVVKSQSVEAGSSVSDTKRIDLTVVHRS